MSELNLLKAIYTKLTAVQTSGTFYADLGGRIRLLRAKQDEAQPLCVILPNEFTMDRYFDSTGDDAVLTFSIMLFGDKDSATQPFPPETLVAINDKLITLIDRVVITATGFGNVQIWGVNLGGVAVEGNAWAITSTWELTASPG